MSESTNDPPLTLREIAHIWWPLAGSWALMTLEGPAQSAIVARLANAEVNLAAWGGIVSSFSFFIASPVIMMMSASTALAKDYPTYRQLRRFTMQMGLALTLLHILIAFTPLYYVVARRIIGAPEAIIEPGRIGMMIVTPWAWAIGFRRFNQGLMIRYGHSKAVGFGTMIRLGSNLIVLLTGYAISTIPGIIVACTAVAHSLFIKGLGDVKARTASIIACLEPVYGIAAAALLLAEVPGLRVTLGGVVILAATFYATLGSRR